MERSLRKSTVGLWLVPLGYLAGNETISGNGSALYWSLAGVCYLIDLLAAFLLARLSESIHSFIIIPLALAEIAMVLYLLIVGSG